jgi:hypothetical protein
LAITLGSRRHKSETHAQIENAQAQAHGISILLVRKLLSFEKLKVRVFGYASSVHICDTGLYLQRRCRWGRVGEHRKLFNEQYTFVYM